MNVISLQLGQLSLRVDIYVGTHIANNSYFMDTLEILWEVNPNAYLRKTGKLAKMDVRAGDKISTYQNQGNKSKIPSFKVEINNE